MRRHVMLDREWPRSRYWLCHFLYSRHERAAIPWGEPAVESDLDAHAADWLSWQIHLNEASRQRLIAHAAAQCAADPAYVQCLRLFVREEQNHQAMVTHWLDTNGFPTGEHGTLRSAMRFAIRPLGLRFELSVLLLGEVVVLTMNRLLYEHATDPALRGVLRQIIADHEQHIAFHSERLTAEYADFNFIRRNLRRLRLRGMFTMLTRGVTWQRRELLAAMDVCPKAFREGARRNFESVLGRMVPYHRAALLAALGQQREQRYDKPVRV